MEIKKVFNQRKHKKFRADKGSEFINKDVKTHMRDNDVNAFKTANQHHASHVERVQRRIKSLLWRYLGKKRNYRYIDDLQNVVDNYNATSHRSLNYVAPKDVTKKNDASLWAYMYLKRSKSTKTKPRFKFSIGDFVRISYLKEPFRRSYQQQYTTEIFKIKQISQKEYTC